MRRLLIVDDDLIIRKNISEYFCKVKKDEVILAENGQEALGILEKDSDFNAIILDLRMPVMDGGTLLSRINEMGIDIPPIIVLSAHISSNALKEYGNIGTIHWLPKPLDPMILEEVLSEISSGNVNKLKSLVEKVYNSSCMDPESVKNMKSYNKFELSDYINAREDSLKDYVKGKINSTSLGFKLEEPLLVVARRWNSWYPSFFDVTGGAYAILAPSLIGKDKDDKNNVKINAAIIDPGFRAVDALRGEGISLADISSCIITHNHPDHMAGVYEFLALRHVLGKQTSVYCNSSLCEMLQVYTGYAMQMKMLDSIEVSLFSRYKTSENMWQEICINDFKTEHYELGIRDDTRGIIIKVNSGPEAQNLNRHSHTVILGDTCYERSRNKAFVNEIVKNNMKVAVLHIGSSQMKGAAGKHLYIPGLEKLLYDIESELDRIEYSGELLVLISEWGLEHATAKQIEKITGHSVDGFNDESPIKDLVKYLGRNLSKVRLLPADVGLKVGLESGYVYLNDGTKVSPSEIDYETDDDGMVYLKK